MLGLIEIPVVDTIRGIRSDEIEHTIIHIYQNLKYSSNQLFYQGMGLGTSSVTSEYSTLLNYLVARLRAGDQWWVFYRRRPSLALTCLMGTATLCNPGT